MEVKELQEICSMVFSPADNMPWVMKILKEKSDVSIQFNTKEYPDLMPNDFAKAVCEILCKTGYMDEIYEAVKKQKDSSK
jgi:hypothetical protein